MNPLRPQTTFDTSKIEGAILFQLTEGMRLCPPPDKQQILECAETLRRLRKAAEAAMMAIKARDRMLMAHRVGQSPTEATFAEMESTKDILKMIAAALEGWK